MAEQERFQWLREQAEAMGPRLSSWRRDLHRYPETGWLEMRTSSLIARELLNQGWQVLTGAAVCAPSARRGLPDEEQLAAHYAWALANGADRSLLPACEGGCTGVVASRRFGPGPTVALRFDIDALPVTESAAASHFPRQAGFASVIPGQMHACGHDGHAAIGLGVAKLLTALAPALTGQVRLLFQPAEEGVRGAAALAAAGHLADVDYLLAAHILGRPEAADYPLAVCEQGLCGLATAKFDLIFSGLAAHAGEAPEQGKNAMLAAAAAVQNLYAMPRYGNIPTQINVGRLLAGSGRNVICDQARLECEVRGATSAANDYLLDYARRVAAGAALMHDCQLEFRLLGSAPAGENSPALCRMLAHIARSRLALPVEEVDDLLTGSEDFFCLAQQVLAQQGQSCYFGILTPPVAPAHSSRFDFDEAVLPTGVAAFCALTLELLSR